jgi:hypothetical protein
MTSRTGAKEGGLARRLIGISTALLLPAIPVLWYDQGAKAGLISAATLLTLLAGGLAATVRRRR